jgi:general secretion pathway protein H
MRARRVNQRRRYQGFSLIEMLLVLALITVVGTITILSMTSWSRAAQVQRAADQLANHLAETRLNAISTGRMFALTHTENAYQIRSIDELTEETENSSTKAEFIKEVTLPEGVYFLNVVTYGDQRATVAEQQGITATAYFYPDGTSSTIELSLTNQTETSQGTSYTVSLRGITGIALVQQMPSDVNPYTVGKSANGGGP